VRSEFGRERVCCVLQRTVSVAKMYMIISLAAEGSETYRRKVAFSDSLLRLKLSRLWQILTNLFREKNPELSAAFSPFPISRKALVLNRALGLGTNSRLKDGNTEFGIAPRLAAVGAGCGGTVVGGRGWLGLKTTCRSKPNSYASGAATSELRKLFTT
jgi:hypothetical protein